MRFILLTICLLSVGCTTIYNHPSKGLQAWAQDFAACEAQGGQASAGGYDQYGIIRQRVVHNCLAGKGWEKE